MISSTGLNLIRGFESLRLKAYPDPGTRGAPWTLGYGHTAGVSKGDTCTAEQANKWLLEDATEAEVCIDAWVDVELSQNQRDALISWIFNLGCTAFKGSTLLKLLNAGKYGAIPGQIKRWNKSQGKVMAGLTRRRAAEAELFALS